MCGSVCRIHIVKLCISLILLVCRLLDWYALVGIVLPMWALCYPCGHCATLVGIVLPLWALCYPCVHCATLVGIVLPLLALCYPCVHCATLMGIVLPLWALCYTLVGIVLLQLPVQHYYEDTSVTIHVLQRLWEH